MCYLIAKKFNKEGAVAYKTKHGKGLVEFNRRLEKIALNNDVQIVTISKPSAYGEYEPYSFVSSKLDFENAVKSMC